MDYVKEIGAFYDWLETNTVTDSAITLWHALMHTCSRAGWPDEFAVAISTLNNKTGLKKDAIIRARHRLQQSGRIDFQSRSGQQSAIYRIIPFEVASLKPMQSENNTHSVGLNDAKHDANRAQSATQPATQTASINKDLSSSASSSSTNAYESFYAAHIRVFGFACNPLQANKLGAYIDQDGMEEAVVVRAIERAGLATASQYTFSLITKILDDYFVAGVLTLVQAQNLDMQFEQRKQKPRVITNNLKTRSFAEMARGMES